MERQKCQISVLSFVAIRFQCHTNVSKPETLLDGVNVGQFKCRECRCGLNFFFFLEGMNNIFNVKVHLKTCRGNIKYFKLNVTDLIVLCSSF